MNKQEYYILIKDNAIVIQDLFCSTLLELVFQSNIPNVPFYHQYPLFDRTNIEMKRNMEEIKRLKMKEVIIFMPDEAQDIYVDQTIFREYFYTCNVKKVSFTYYGHLLANQKDSYVSISKSVRAIVVQYINKGQSLNKKFYCSEYTELEQIQADIRSLYMDGQLEKNDVFIFDINKNMEEFERIGSMVDIPKLLCNRDQIGISIS